MEDIQAQEDKFSIPNDIRWFSIKNNPKYPNTDMLIDMIEYIYNTSDKDFGDKPFAETDNETGENKIDEDSFKVIDIGIAAKEAYVEGQGTINAGDYIFDYQDHLGRENKGCIHFDSDYDNSAEIYLFNSDEYFYIPFVIINSVNPQISSKSTSLGLLKKAKEDLERMNDPKAKEWIEYCDWANYKDQYKSQERNSEATMNDAIKKDIDRSKMKPVDNSKISGNPGTKIDYKIFWN